MEIQELLKLIHKKYPDSWTDMGMWPVLWIFDDGSGKIIKDATIDVYAEGNVLFDFQNLQELIDHLTDAHVPAQPSLFDHENKRTTSSH